MKIRKGDAGYIKRHKRNTITKAAFEFGIVLALFVLGIVQTKTRMNLLTVIAILGCLPASKALVEVIMIVPHKSTSEVFVDEVNQCAGDMTLVYDLVLTTEKKILPINCIAIAGNNICGYSPDSKTDVEFAAKHMKQMLYANRFTKVSVKIFREQEIFLKRLAEMKKISHEEEQRKDHETAIKQVILGLSL